MASNDKPSTEKTNNGAESTQAHQPTWRNPGVLLAAILLVIVIFAAGIFAGHIGVRHRMRSLGGYGFGPRAGMMGGYSAGTNQNRIQGVVTAVNGNTLTVAGNGATNNVQTTDSTQYVGGSKPAVNDTVVAFGSTSNGTFTATQITINP